ncbi:helix-turn-helix domain-containing protein [Lutimaribacter marinistellae]|uniref:Helix-turn-helix domain-containing protein n=1 Tax=Lutimaribacter marinistellae TaxID=1820329 RepID=A0ABV7TD59_9RHOB
MQGSNASFGRFRNLGALPDLLGQALGQKGLDQVFRTRNVSPEQARKLDGVLLMRDLFALFHHASIATGIRSIGLEAARSRTIHDLGLYGRHISQAPILIDALHRSNSALRYHSSGNILTVHVDKNELSIRYRSTLENLNGWRHMGDFSLYMFRSLAACYLGDAFSPLRIETSCEDPAALQDLEEYFDAPAIGGHDWHSIVLPRDVSHAPLLSPPKPDEIVQLDDLNRLGRTLPDSFEKVVEAIIDLRLNDGASDIEGVAQTLGLGPRSLQRRITEHGLTYRQLLQRRRMHRASNLLANPSLTIQQIGHKAGYADTAQFTRAFKDSVGITPSDFREMYRRLSPPEESRPDSRLLVGI